MSASLVDTASASPMKDPMERPQLVWGAATAAERGPVIATLRNLAHRNAIGTHAGGYSVYRALAVAARPLARDHRPDLTDTAPGRRDRRRIRNGATPAKIVSLDPWGHLVGEVFRDQIAARLRHPADHRGHPRPHRHARDPRRHRGRPHPGRRQDRVDARQRAGDEGGDRSGLVSARHGGALRRCRVRSATRGCTSRPAACIPELVTRPDLEGLPPADRRRHRLLLRRAAKGSPTARRRSPAACTTSATAPTCSAPTSAPAGPISRTASRSASRWRRTAASASWSTIARRDAPSARSPSSWSTTPASATAGWRPRRHLFQAHRMRRRRAGHAVSGADAGCAALARHRPHRSLRLDERHEVRRAASGRASRSTNASRCPTR